MQFSSFIISMVKYSGGEVSVTSVTPTDQKQLVISCAQKSHAAKTFLYYIPVQRTITLWLCHLKTANPINLRSLVLWPAWKTT